MNYQLIFHSIPQIEMYLLTIPLSLILLYFAKQFYTYRKTGAMWVTSTHLFEWWGSKNVFSILIEGKIPYDVIAKQYPHHWFITYVSPWKLKCYTGLFFFAALYALIIPFFEIRNI